MPSRRLHRKHRKHRKTAQIVCLDCGETRELVGADAGECPGCHYLGWTYAEELDSCLRRQIIDRALSRRSPVSPLRR